MTRVSDDTKKWPRTKKMQDCCLSCYSGNKICSARYTHLGLLIKAMASVSQNTLLPQHSDVQETDCISTSIPNSTSFDNMPTRISHCRNIYNRDSAKDINQGNIFRDNQRAFTNIPQILPESPNHSQVTPAAFHHRMEVIWLRHSPAVHKVSGNCTNTTPLLPTTPKALAMCHCHNCFSVFHFFLLTRGLFSASC